jgi:hypothetical protein
MRDQMRAIRLSVAHRVVRHSALGVDRWRRAPAFSSDRSQFESCIKYYNPQNRPKNILRTRKKEISDGLNTNAREFKGFMRGPGEPATFQFLEAAPKLSSKAPGLVETIQGLVFSSVYRSRKSLKQEPKRYRLKRFTPSYKFCGIPTSIVSCPNLKTQSEVPCGRHSDIRERLHGVSKVKVLHRRRRRGRACPKNISAADDIRLFNSMYVGGSGPCLATFGRKTYM